MWNISHLTRIKKSGVNLEKSLKIAVLLVPVATGTWSSADKKGLNRDHKDLNLFCVKIYTK